MRIGDCPPRNRRDRAAITFDTGLSSRSNGAESAMKVYTHAKERGLVVATPKVTVAAGVAARTGVKRSGET
jgi:hypothetical protein